MSEKQVDPRIGKHGVYEPSVCAVTGQKAPRARACTNISLGNGYYYRVLAKAVHRADKPAIAKELEKAMSALAGTQPKVVRKKKEERES